MLLAAYMSCLKRTLLQPLSYVLLSVTVIMQFLSYTMKAVLTLTVLGSNNQSLNEAIDAP